jgi:hypothetical protein
MGGFVADTKVIEGIGGIRTYTGRQNRAAKEFEQIHPLAKAAATQTKTGLLEPRGYLLRCWRSAYPDSTMR